MFLGIEETELRSPCRVSGDYLQRGRQSAAGVGLRRRWVAIFTHTSAHNKRAPLPNFVRYMWLLAAGCCSFCSVLLLPCCGEGRADPCC